MYTKQTDLARLLSGTRAFVVPQFQRHYKWKVNEWQEIWNDLEAQYWSSEVQTGNIPVDEGHFLGSVVLHPAPGPSTTVSRYWVIDGQQRLTTILIVIAAIREFRKRTDPSWDPGEYTNQYLINPYSSESPHRLEPGRADRDDFIATVYENEPSGQIGNAFRWFSRKLRQFSGSTEGFEVEKVMSALLLRFLVVEINTSTDDNINEIFNTINYAGVRLTGIDLIRNHAFMQFPGDEADDIHASLWQPMEAELGEATLEQYFWAQLVRFYPDATQRDTYGPFQRRLRELNRSSDEGPSESARSELRRLRDEIPHFLAATQPDAAREYPRDLAVILLQLQQWGSQTYVPIALETLARLDRHTIDLSNAIATLKHVMSYLVRRAIAGVPTNNLNRVLSGIPGATRTDNDFAEAVARELRKSGSYWPTDRELAERGRSTPIGATLKPGQLKYVLESVCLPSSSRESPQSFVVQEIMPTPLPENWRSTYLQLGEDPELASTRGNTIGNLTLVPAAASDPAEVGLGSFEIEELRGEPLSPFTWGPSEIDRRSAALLEVAQVIWPRADLKDENEGSSSWPASLPTSTLTSAEAILELLPADAVVAIDDLAAVTARPKEVLLAELARSGYAVIDDEGTPVVGSLPSMTEEETRIGDKLALDQLQSRVFGDGSDGRA